MACCGHTTSDHGVGFHLSIGYHTFTEALEFLLPVVPVWSVAVLIARFWFVMLDRRPARHSQSTTLKMASGKTVGELVSERSVVAAIGTWLFVGFVVGSHLAITIFRYTDERMFSLSYCSFITMVHILGMEAAILVTSGCLCVLALLLSMD